MDVGAPQGSVLAATLFRLHVHFLPSYFLDLAVHMFADDLAIVIPGSLEKRFSLNVKEIQEKAKMVMRQLEKFSNGLSLFGKRISFEPISDDLKIGFRVLF